VSCLPVPLVSAISKLTRDGRNGLAERCLGKAVAKDGRAVSFVGEVDPRSLTR